MLFISQPSETKSWKNDLKRDFLFLSVEQTLLLVKKNMSQPREKNCCPRNFFLLRLEKKFLGLKQPHQRAYQHPAFVMIEKYSSGFSNFLTASPLKIKMVFLTLLATQFFSKTDSSGEQVSKKCQTGAQFKNTPTY